MIENMKAMWEGLRRKKRLHQDFSRTFEGESGQRVLANIQSFCMANQRIPIDATALQMARAEGARDVWLHIQSYLHYDEDHQMRLAKLHQTEQQEYAA